MDFNFYYSVAIFQTIGEKVSQLFESKEDEEARKHEQQTNGEYIGEKLDNAQEKLSATSDGIKEASADSLGYIQTIPGNAMDYASSMQKKLGKLKTILPHS